MKKSISRLVAAISLFALVPTFAFADFNSAATQAKTQVAALSQQQLDGLNPRVFTDAYIAAKIVGYDPTELAQLRTDVNQLRAENAELRSQLSSLQGTLGNVVRMLTLLLAKLV
jgi:hypothetical protein